MIRAVHKYMYTFIHVFIPWRPWGLIKKRMVLLKKLWSFDRFANKAASAARFKGEAEAGWEDGARARDT